MSLNNLRCELHWERPKSELGLQVDLALARMLLALPARWKPAAMQHDALGNHWEFEPLPRGPRSRPEPGAAPMLTVKFTADEGDLDEDFSDLIDVEQVVHHSEVLWPSIQGLRELVSGAQSGARLERFLRAVIRDRERALLRLCDRPFDGRLVAMQRRLHLSSAETAILRFCALVRHDADVREVAGNFQRLRSSIRAPIIAASLGIAVTEFIDATRSRSGLMRFGLLDRQAPDLTEVDMDPMAAMLDGLRDEADSGRDPLAGIMLPVPASERVETDFSHLRIPIGAIQAAIEQAWSAGRAGCNVLLHGAPGHGKTQIARLLASRLKAAAFEVPVEDESGEPRPGDSRARSAVLCQHALSELDRPLLVFDEAEDLFPVPSLSWLFDAGSRPKKGWINSLLEGTRVPTIWIANQVSHIDPAILRRFDLILEVPAPPRAVRSRLLDHALGATTVSPRWREQLLGLEDLSPAELERLARAQAFAPQGQVVEAFLQDVFEEARKAGGQPVHTGEVLLPSRYSLDTVNADAEPVRLLAHGDRLIGLAKADDWLNAHEAADAAHKTKRWLGEPPTDKQLAHLPPAARQDFGLTRYQASAHLCFRFNRSAIQRLIWQAHTGDPAFVRRFLLPVAFAVPPRPVRRRIAERHLGSSISEELITELAADDELLPSHFGAARRALELQPGADPATVVRETISAMRRVLLGSPLKRARQPATRFEIEYLNLAGGIAPGRISDALARNGRGTLCFYGPPGTGKTEFAHVLADALGRELVARSASDILSPWVGMSERNLADLFTGVDAERSVLFLDEVDSLLRDRRLARHGWEATQVNELLQQMERFPGIFVAATNLADNLDAAALRRFDFKLHFRPLLASQRRALFARETLGEADQSRQLPRAVIETLDTLDMLTPGDFANVARQQRLLDERLSPEDYLRRLLAECRWKQPSTLAA